MLNPDFDCVFACPVYELAKVIASRHALEANLTVDGYIIHERYLFDEKSEKDRSRDIMRRIREFEAGNTNPSECFHFNERAT